MNVLKNALLMCLVLIFSMLSGCSKPEAPPAALLPVAQASAPSTEQPKGVSFADWSKSQAQSKINALKNAGNYKAASTRFKNWNGQPISRGDTTIGSNCPGGKGWASVTLMRSKPAKAASGAAEEDEHIEREVIWCSTKLPDICVREADRERKDLAPSWAEINSTTCPSINEVPYPLPVL